MSVIWWLVGCAGGAGGGKGPLELPGRLETVVRVTECSDGHAATEEVNTGTGEVTNPGDPRIVTTVQPVVPDDIDEDGVYIDVWFDGDGAVSAHEADLGGGESADIVADAGLFCVGGSLPKSGHYDRKIPITSTDLLGGDEVTQQIEVRVTVQ